MFSFFGLVFFLLARESRFFFIFPCMNSSKLKMDAVFSLLCSAHSLDFSEVFLSRCFLLYPPCRIPLEWLSYFQNVERWRWGLYTTQTFLSPHQRMVSILQSEAQSTVMWTAHSPFRLCVLTSLFFFVYALSLAVILVSGIKHFPASLSDGTIRFSIRSTAGILFFAKVSTKHTNPPACHKTCQMNKRENIPSSQSLPQVG